MTGRELGALIKRTKGPIYVDFHSPHDPFRVQAVKSDLIRALDFDGPAHLELCTDNSGAKFICAKEDYS